VPPACAWPRSPWALILTPTQFIEDLVTEDSTVTGSLASALRLAEPEQLRLPSVIERD
jgi:hypothetical protein